MKHAVKQIHFVGMASLSREQGSRMRDATGGEGCRMPTQKFDERGVAG
jgi:hypothetical protein